MICQQATNRFRPSELTKHHPRCPLTGVTKEVKRYVEGCDACQHNKNRTEQPAGKLMPNSIPERPWMHISADFITKLPLAQGYDSILVVVD